MGSGNRDRWPLLFHAYEVGVCGSAPHAAFQFACTSDRQACKRAPTTPMERCNAFTDTDYGIIKHLSSVSHRRIMASQAGETDKGARWNPLHGRLCDQLQFFKNASHADKYETCFTPFGVLAVIVHVIRKLDSILAYARQRPCHRSRTERKQLGQDSGFFIIHYHTNFLVHHCQSAR